MSYHNILNEAVQSKTNAQGQVAPPGYHYMPDGSLMADVEHVKLTGSKIITRFDLDLSDLPATSERRRFNVYGDRGAEFKLEIKDNTTGYYYNFVTNAFQADASSLEEEISSNSYNGSITFPAVTGGDDQYDISLYAKPGTEHVAYNEFRFGDGSLDINNSTGSNSLMMQKVIYQYAALTLTLAGYSIDGTVVVGAGGVGTDTISINRGKPNAKTAFSFTTTAGATAAYRILKQPVASDVLAFVQPVVGSAPIDLPGENIYPTVTAYDNTNAVMSSTATVTMTQTIEDLEIKVGDKVIQAAGPYFANLITVVAITGGGLNAYQFTASEAVSVGNGVRLNFHNRVNFSWPINKYADILKEDMIVLAGGAGTADTSIGAYEDTVTLFAGTKQEKVIIKNKLAALGTLAKKPTVVKGLVTVQEGQVVFDKQQPLALAGTTLKVGGYGESEILRIYGWEVKFTDLTIALTAPTTTTTEATSAHATIAVADREGIINTVSTVSGIGINPALADPTLTTGGGLDGAGDWIMSAVQTLESGITLTVGNTGRIATITGNIEIVKAGTTDQTLRFDINKLLSTSAP
jgi:hypothetical protein